MPPSFSWVISKDITLNKLSQPTIERSQQTLDKRYLIAGNLS